MIRLLPWLRRKEPTLTQLLRIVAETSRPTRTFRQAPRQRAEKARVQDDNVTRDRVAATYREIKLREGGAPAYQAAVRVYKGHHPTVSDAAARKAVNKIVAAVLHDRKQGS